MVPMNILQRLGSLIHRPSASAPATDTSSAPASAADTSSATAFAPAAAPAGGAAALSDPIVVETNQQAQQAAESQAQAVPAEDEALQAEQHVAWAANDFDRCIVIFSRLLELHPDDPDYKEKLGASYFNRGKQYEAQGDEQKAMALYYSCLSVSPDHGDAYAAAEQMVQQHGG
jgi:tetratricopeptide (TPR) repeat protein